MLLLRRWRAEDLDPYAVICAGHASIIQVGNGRSERIAMNLGMFLERERIDSYCGRQVHVFAL